MKQKNYNWLIYVFILVVLAGVGYLAFTDINPINHHVETVISAF